MEKEAQCRLNQCAGNAFNGRRPSVVISVLLHISADLPGIAGATRGWAPNLRQCEQIRRKDGNYFLSFIYI